MRWEIHRLCRGGSRNLTPPGVCLSSQVVTAHRVASKGRSEPEARGSAVPNMRHPFFDRLRTGPFEGPATGKPPALPEDLTEGGFLWDQVPNVHHVVALCQTKKLTSISQRSCLECLLHFPLRRQFDVWLIRKCIKNKLVQSTEAICHQDTHCLFHDDLPRSINILAT